MARPRKFDEEATLEAVTQVFWHKGYEGTSINDLIQVTGLRPGSLYAAFCNKRHLFLLCLDRYAQNLERELAQFFSTESPPFTQIDGFFNLFIEYCEATPQGCFLVNTLFEANLEDKDVLERVQNLFKQLESRFTALFEIAQTNHQLNPQFTPDMAAKVVISAIYGLRGYSKFSVEIETLRVLKGHIMSLLFTTHHSE